jgi:hypothetical protein
MKFVPPCQLVNAKMSQPVQMKKRKSKEARHKTNWSVLDLPGSVK